MSDYTSPFRRCGVPSDHGANRPQPEGVKHLAAIGSNVTDPEGQPLSWVAARRAGRTSTLRRMGDIKLFRTSPQGAIELEGKSVVIEKTLQTLMEANLEAFLGV